MALCLSKEAERSKEDNDHDVHRDCIPLSSRHLSSPDVCFAHRWHHHQLTQRCASTYKHRMWLSPTLTSKRLMKLERLLIVDSVVRNAS